LALIKLKEPAMVQPVELASFSDSLIYDHHMPAKVLGWGKTFFGTNNSDSLRLGDCFFIDRDTCAALYSVSQPNFHAFNEGGNICAGYYAGTMPVGSASGDSGGPLFFDDNGIVKQVGIVSGGRFEITTQDFPGVYTLVPKYKTWLDSIILNNTVITSNQYINEEEITIRYYANELIEVNQLSKTDKYNFMVYDFSGREKVSFKITDRSLRFQYNISSFESGLYIIIVQNITTGFRTKKKILVH